MSKRLILLILFGLLLAACKANATTTPTADPTFTVVAPESDPGLPTATETLVEPSATPTPEPSPTITNTPDPLGYYPAEGYGPVDFPENINPLTGLAVADVTRLERRPVSVKISSYPRGIRPQWGLSLADHVFEYYHEGGLTRFFAVFYGQDATQIGPIRSARFPDEHLVRMYKSVLAFGNADINVWLHLNSTEFWNRLMGVSDVPCPPTTTYPTCRIEPDSWNHLMTDSAVLSDHFSAAGIENGRQYLDGLLFQAGAPADGQPGENIITRYSFGDYNQWSYNPETRKYQRYHDTSVDEGGGETFELLTDRLTGDVIQADNVVILLASHSYRSTSPEVIEIALYGFGKAYVLRDGQAYYVNWARVGANDLISLTYDDGSRFPLKPGNTWFQVVGVTSSVSQDGANWRVQFSTP